MPVGKPAPPRPRSPLAFIVLMIQLGALRDGVLHSLIAVQLNVLVDIRRALAEPPLETTSLHRDGRRARHYSHVLSAGLAA